MLPAITKGLVSLPVTFLKSCFLRHRIVVSVVSDGKSFIRQITELRGMKDVEVSPVLFRVERDVDDSTKGVFYRFLIIKGEILCKRHGTDNLDIFEVWSTAKSMGLEKPNVESALLLCKLFALSSGLPDNITVFTNPIKAFDGYPDFLFNPTREGGVTGINPLTLSSSVVWEASDYFAFIWPYKQTEAVPERIRERSFHPGAVAFNT